MGLVPAVDRECGAANPPLALPPLRKRGVEKDDDEAVAAASGGTPAPSLWVEATSGLPHWVDAPKAAALTLDLAPLVYASTELVKSERASGTTSPPPLLSSPRSGLGRGLL